MELTLGRESIFDKRPELQTLIVREPDRAALVLRDVIRECRREKREQLVAEAYYYLAETHFRLGDARKVISNALHGITYASQSGGAQWLLPKLCNIAGIGYSSVGEYAVSQQYYLDALKYAHQFDDKSATLSINNNIGSLFLQLGDYQEALQYASAVYTDALGRIYDPQFDELTPQEQSEREEMFFVAVLNMADIAYYEQDYETAHRYLEQVESLSEREIDNMYACNVKTIRAKLYLGEGRLEEAVETLRALIKDVGGAPETADLFEDLYEIGGLLLEQGELDTTKGILDVLLEVCQVLDNVSRWTTYYDLLVRYYREAGQEREYLIACAQYHKFASKNAEEFNHSMLLGIKNQLEVDRQMQRQKYQAEQAEEMRLLSETDELTRLLNRRSFNKLSQKYFETAMDKKQSFGLIMMDVDFFKQYNDHYGHLAGDECLKSVAEVLRHNDGNGYLSSRYGGDEFIIIVRNHSDAEVTEHMQTILEEIRTMKREHCKSQVADIVTVTLGAVNMVPRSPQTVMDTVQQADDALYRAKSEGKNRYCLG